MNSTKENLYIVASEVYAKYLAYDEDVRMSWGTTWSGHEELLSYEELVSIGHILQRFVDKDNGWVKLEIRHTFDDDENFAVFSFGQRNELSLPRVHV